MHEISQTYLSHSMRKYSAVVRNCMKAICAYTRGNGISRAMSDFLCAFLTATLFEDLDGFHYVAAVVGMALIRFK